LPLQQQHSSSSSSSTAATSATTATDKIAEGAAVVKAAQEPAI